jgi:GNAT superfamily N-acetyltransferase
MQIRELDPERDARDIIQMIRETWPTAVVTERSWLHQHRSVPARAEPRWLVAQSDERVVGRADVYRNFFSKETGRAFVGLGVRIDHRRRGIGGALYEAALEHARSLEADGLLTSFFENPDGVAFAHSHGFREVRAERESILDPRSVAETPPAETDLRPVKKVDLRDVHRIDAESTLDVPATETIDDIPYDEWLQHVPAHPLFTDEGSFVAFVDGEPAALSIVLADLETGRAANMYTGTLRAYRGRGLARAVKLASIRWAAEHGIESMVTTNDETNAPMLAVNRRLGYRPGGRRVELVVDL